MRTRTLAALALAPIAGAASPPLGAPLVVKLDWGCDAVRAADLNGDGRTDLALLNRDTARVELLLRRAPGEKADPKRTLRPNRWEPELDDAPFRRLSLAGDPDMRSLALGDLAGAGRTDLAYTGGRDALTVVFRNRDGEYLTRRTHTRHESLQGDRTLAIARLGDHRRASLVMLAKEGLLVFPPFSGDGPLPEPALYKCDTAGAGALTLADINADGRADITYLVRGDRPELRVRLGLAAGGFGPERALQSEYSDIRLSTRVTTPGGRAGYAAVNRQARRMEIVAFTDDASPWREAEYAAPATHTLATVLRTPALAVTGDIAGNGVRELLVGDPRGARVRLFRRPAPAADFGECEDFPALSQLSAIAFGRFDGRSPGLLQLSEKENVLGHATFDAAGHPGFPVEIKLDAPPVAMTVAEFSGPGKTEAAVITRTDKGKTALVTLRRGDDGTFQPAATLELGEFRREIEGLLTGDFTGDGKPDLVLLVAREPARLFANRGAGAFAEIATESAQRKAMLSGATPADITFGDLAGDGKSALVVSATGFVRALRADAAGELRVVAQANTRRPTDKLRAPVIVKLDDGRPGLLGYNDNDRGLEWLAPDATGVFRHRRTVETGALDPLGALLLPAETGAPRLVHVGKDRISVSDLNVAGPRLTVLDRYETDLPGTVHDHLEVGDFTGSGRPDIVLLDTRTHRLEMLTRTGDHSAWRSLLHFELFDENPFYRGRRNAGAEPHDALCADLSAPGAADLVLLMHDRLLVYPGAGAPPKR